MSKIFCIGLNKTGTLSLHEALTILGYHSLHWGGQKAHRQAARALRERRPLLTYLDDDYDAVSDVAVITANFDVADRQYPDSKFILTVRALNEWLDSRRRHVEKNQVRKVHGAYDGRFLEVDLEGWEAEYREHHARVLDYFAGRPDDLLVIDITAGSGWQPLCAFLRRPVPDVPFPWLNRYRPWTGPHGTSSAAEARR
jgi:hypothetical protein